MRTVACDKKERNTVVVRSYEVVEAVVVRHKHQSDRLNCALVSLCQTSSDCRQKQYYRAVGLAKKRNNSSCVPAPLEHPNSWDIGGLSVVQWHWYCT